MSGYSAYVCGRSDLVETDERWSDYPYRVETDAGMVDVIFSAF